MVALTAGADEFAEKVEKEHQLALIAKSNVMRKAAKEKDAELTEVEQQLNAKLHGTQQLLAVFHTTVACTL
jgi:hypothetical protein